MNTNTGRIYEPDLYRQDAIDMASDVARGDVVVPVSPRVARLMREALARRRRRAASRRAMQAASRRANRR